MTEATSPCVDCGEQVPTIRTGHGDLTLPRCPGASEHHRATGQDFHRVRGDDFRAALAAQDGEALA